MGVSDLAGETASESVQEEQFLEEFWLVASWSAWRQKGVLLAVTVARGPAIVAPVESRSPQVYFTCSLSRETCRFVVEIEVESCPCFVVSWLLLWFVVR